CHGLTVRVRPCPPGTPNTYQYPYRTALLAAKTTKISQKIQNRIQSAPRMVAMMLQFFAVREAFSAIAKLPRIFWSRTSLDLMIVKIANGQKRKMLRIDQTR